MPKPSNTNISEDTTTGTISNATLLDHPPRQDSCRVS